MLLYTQLADDNYRNGHRALNANISVRRHSAGMRWGERNERIRWKETKCDQQQNQAFSTNSMRMISAMGVWRSLLNCSIFHAPFDVLVYLLSSSQHLCRHVCVRGCATVCLDLFRCAIVRLTCHFRLSALTVHFYEFLIILPFICQFRLDLAMEWSSFLFTKWSINNMSVQLSSHWLECCH